MPIELNFPVCFRIPQFLLYTKVAYPIFYYVPMILIVTFSVAIAIKIKVLQKKRQVTGRQWVSEITNYRSFG